MKKSKTILLHNCDGCGQRAVSCSRCNHEHFCRFCRAKMVAKQPGPQVTAAGLRMTASLRQILLAEPTVRSLWGGWFSRCGCELAAIPGGSSHS